MNYNEQAEQLLQYLIIYERLGFGCEERIQDIASGEIATLMFLLKKNRGVNPKEISNYFNINSSRVAAISKSLCKKGYAYRINDEHDKRKALIFITEQGKSYSEDKRNTLLKSMAHILSLMGEDDAKEHLRIMKKLVNMQIEMKGESEYE